MTWSFSDMYPEKSGNGTKYIGLRTSRVKQQDPRVSNLSDFPGHHHAVIYGVWDFRRWFLHVTSNNIPRTPLWPRQAALEATAIGPCKYEENTCHCFVSLTWKRHFLWRIRVVHLHCDSLFVLNIDKMWSIPTLFVWLCMFIVCLTKKQFVWWAMILKLQLYSSLSSLKIQIQCTSCVIFCVSWLGLVRHCALHLRDVANVPSVFVLSFVQLKPFLSFRIDSSFIAGVLPLFCVIATIWRIFSHRIAQPLYSFQSVSTEMVTLIDVVALFHVEQRPFFLSLPPPSPSRRNTICKISYRLMTHIQTFTKERGQVLFTFFACAFFLLSWTAWPWMVGEAPIGRTFFTDSKKTNKFHCSSETNWKHFVLLFLVWPILPASLSNSRHHPVGFVKLFPENRFHWDVAKWCAAFMQVSFTVVTVITMNFVTALFLALEPCTTRP